MTGVRPRTCPLAIACSLVIAIAWSLALVPAATAVSPERARVEGTNPSLGQRIVRYDRWVRAAQRPPDVLILGSSRSVELDPAQVRRLTGQATFNAGISSATPRELRAMAQYADLRTPGRYPHLVVMLSIEAFQNVRRSTVRVRQYQSRIDRTYAACGEVASCGRDWMVAARRLSLDALRRQAGDDGWLRTQRADGKQVDSMLRRWDREGVDMERLRDRRIAIRVRSYRPGGFDRLYPAPMAAFEDVLATANARGVRPYVALTSMHPRCIRICGPAGWNARRSEARQYLSQLQERHDFGLLDMSHASSWKGTAADFYDEVHPRPSGAAKIVRRLASVGAFERRAVE